MLPRQSVERAKGGGCRLADIVPAVENEAQDRRWTLSQYRKVAARTPTGGWRRVTGSGDGPMSMHAA